MTRHHLGIPTLGRIVCEKPDYSPHTASCIRGPDVKHRTHRFPLGRHTTHLSNEGLADVVLYGVLIVDTVGEGIGETHD